MDFRGACIVPLYKGKGDKCECINSRGISLLSVVGKLFGRVYSHTLSDRTGSALVWHSEGRTRLTQCSKSCDL